MKPKDAKLINVIGAILWTFIFPVVTPYDLIKKYPYILLGYIYPLIIIGLNYILIGNYEVLSDDEIDFKDENTLELINILNNKAIQISTAIFALGIVSKEVFKKDFHKEIIIFMIYALIFGVGIIIPIYFVSNFKNKEKANDINIVLARVRNISLSYSVGFMICAFLIALQRIYNTR